MQRAARATWRALVRQWPSANELSVLAGQGNNAGDGYLVAVLARRAGWTVRVLAVGDPQRLQGDAGLAHAEAMRKRSRLSVERAVRIARCRPRCLARHGLRRRCASRIQCHAAINASGLPVAAVDIPSGLSADTGRSSVTRSGRT
jgi:NAD(P)H-hydrate epimerase